MTGRSVLPDEGVVRLWCGPSIGAYCSCFSEGCCVQPPLTHPPPWPSHRSTRCEYFHSTLTLAVLLAPTLLQNPRTSSGTATLRPTISPTTYTAARTSWYAHLHLRTQAWERRLRVPATTTASAGRCKACTAGPHIHLAPCEGTGTSNAGTCTACTQACPSGQWVDKTPRPGTPTSNGVICSSSKTSKTTALGAE